MRAPRVAYEMAFASLSATRTYVFEYSSASTRYSDALMSSSYTVGSGRVGTPSGVRSVLWRGDGAQQVLIDPRRVRPTRLHRASAREAARRRGSGVAREDTREGSGRTLSTRRGCTRRRRPRRFGWPSRRARGPWFRGACASYGDPNKSIAVRGPASGKEVPSESRNASSASKMEAVCAPEYLPRLARVARCVSGRKACSAAKRVSASKLASSRLDAASWPTSATSVRHVAGRQTAETLGEDGSRQVRETHLGGRTPPKRPIAGTGARGDALDVSPRASEGDVPSLRDRHERLRGRVAPRFSSDEATTTTPFPLFPRSGRLEDHNHVARDRAPDTAAAVRGVLSPRRCRRF